MKKAWIRLAASVVLSALLVVGIMAMVMYELFSFIEKHTTAWAHRGSHGE